MWKSKGSLSNLSNEDLCFALFRAISGGRSKSNVKLGVGKFADEMIDVNGSVKATSYKIGSKELTEAKITKLDGLPSTFTSGHWTKNDINNNLTYKLVKISNKN